MSRYENMTKKFQYQDFDNPKFITLRTTGILFLIIAAALIQLAEALIKKGQTMQRQVKSSISVLRKCRMRRSPTITPMHNMSKCYLK